MFQNTNKSLYLKSALAIGLLAVFVSTQVFASGGCGTRGTRCGKKASVPVSKMKELGEDSVELLTVLAANAEKFKEFSQMGPEVAVTSIFVERVSKLVSKFVVNGHKMKEDMVLGDIRMTIIRIQHGETPDHTYFTYEVTISEE